MRPLAILPLLLSAAALVLAFLCLFAGHKTSFMQDYSLLTLNTSRIGEGLVDHIINSTVGDDDSTLGKIWDWVPDKIQNGIEDEAGEKAAEIADKLGIEVRSLPLFFAYGKNSEVDRV